MGIIWTQSKRCPQCNNNQGPARKCKNCSTLGCFKCLSPNIGQSAQCSICNKKGGVEKA